MSMSLDQIVQLPAQANARAASASASDRNDATATRKDDLNTIEEASFKSALKEAQTAETSASDKPVESDHGKTVAETAKGLNPQDQAGQHEDPVEAAPGKTVSEVASTKGQDEAGDESQVEPGSDDAVLTSQASAVAPQGESAQAPAPEDPESPEAAQTSQTTQTPQVQVSETTEPAESEGMASTEGTAPLSDQGTEGEAEETTPPADTTQTATRSWSEKAEKVEGAERPGWGTDTAPRSARGEEARSLKGENGKGKSVTVTPVEETDAAPKTTASSDVIIEETVVPGGDEGVPTPETITTAQAASIVGAATATGATKEATNKTASQSKLVGDGVVNPPASDAAQTNEKAKASPIADTKAAEAAAEKTGLKSETRTEGKTSAAADQQKPAAASAAQQQAAQSATSQSPAQTATQTAAAAANAMSAAQPMKVEVETPQGLRTLEIDPATGTLSTASQSAPRGPAMAATEVTLNFARGRLIQVPSREMGLQIAKQVGEGKNHFEIRINPPELGRVDVRMEVHDNGRVTAHLMTDRPETLDLLQKDRASLARALADSGLDVGHNGLNFSMREGQEGKGQPDAAFNSFGMEVAADAMDLGQTLSATEVSNIERTRYGFDVVRMKRLDLRV